MRRLTHKRIVPRVLSRGASRALWAACLAFSPIAYGQTAHTPIPDPAPLRVKAVYPLPFFCIQEGLQVGRGLLRIPVSAVGSAPDPGTPCLKPPAKKIAPQAPSIFVPPSNADDVAKQLQPQSPAGTPGTASVTAAAVVTGTATATATGTGVPPPNQFTLAATADKRAEIVFCAVKDCSNLDAMKKAIFDLARPKYAYFKDYPIDSEKTGKKLSKAVPVINPKLTAEVISTTKIRVESDKPLTDAELSTFEKRLNRDETAIIAKQVHGTPPDK